MGRGSAVAITGLEYFRLHHNAEGSTIYAVLVTTPTRLYQFHSTLNTAPNRAEERPFLLPLFHSYLNAKENFIEIPSEFPVSKLRIFFSSELEWPVQIAWITGNGVLLAQVEKKKRCSSRYNRYAH